VPKRCCESHLVPKCCLHPHSWKLKILCIHVGVQARSQDCEKRLLAASCLSVCPSVRPHEKSSAPTGRIFMKFCISVFFESLSRKFDFNYNLTIITGTLHEDRQTFVIISYSVSVRMRHVSVKTCRENQPLPPFCVQ
jgi:hypothetical protein